jgi:hypothetical protein
MAANGAVMRTPVIGALFFNDQRKLYNSAINVAAVTHADPRCLVSCTIASGLVAAVSITISTTLECVLILHLVMPSPRLFGTRYIQKRTFPVSWNLQSHFWYSMNLLWMSIKFRDFVTLYGKIHW